MIYLILKGLMPVVVVLALGFYAGRKRYISDEGTRNFSTFTIDFALPCALFVGTFEFTPEQFENSAFILTLFVSLIIPFILGLGISIWLLKKSIGESGLFASNCGFPDMAFVGLPVLVAIIGSQALLPVIVGNLITSIIMVPVIVFMVHRGIPGMDGKGADSIVVCTTSTIKQPVVWAPILGLILVLLHFKLPVLLADSLKLLGRSSGGGALFTLGVLLSHLKMKIDGSTIVVVALKNLGMPALALALSLYFHLDGTLAKGAIITAACPAATFGAMLSAKFQTGQNTIPPEIFVSNIFGIFSMGLWIFIAQRMV